MTNNEQKTPKEKAQENYKVHREYKKIERNYHLPRFIIVIICFLVIIGLFMGLYTEYDFLININPREQVDIDVSTASDAISPKIQLAYVNFFNVLSSASRISSKLVNSFIISKDYSTDNDLNTFLINLNSSGISYVNIHYPLIEQGSMKSFLNDYFTCLADVDARKFFVGYIYPGEMHYAFVHKNNLLSICNDFGWNYTAVSLKFEEFELCYLDADGIMHCFCEYGEGWYD